MAGRLEGQVAVITGGGSGIGRACAERFAEEGADVVVGDIQLERGAEAVRAVEERGRRAVFVEADTSREADNEALAQAALDQFGRLDICVAAAGVSHAGYVSGETAPDEELIQRRYEEQERGLIINRPLEQWARVLDINLTGVMLTDRAVARRMLEAGTGGSIINISSIAGKNAAFGSPEYCVSKAGVWMLTKALGRELAPYGIRVNAIGPGFIETPMTAVFRADEQVNRTWLSLTPMGRFGQAVEIANTALFLASDEASFYSGAILHPDGGVFTE